MPEMNLACLRVEGPEHLLEAIKSAAPATADSSWKAGEKKKRGGVHSLSGFSATVVEAPHPVALLKGIRTFIETCLTRQLRIPEGVTAELAVGITVGDSEQFVASLDLSAQDMARLAKLNINFSFTAYPTSDEANAGI
jgi:hypothetical protein